MLPVLNLAATGSRFNAFRGNKTRDPVAGPPGTEIHFRAVKLSGSLRVVRRRETPKKVKQKFRIIPINYNIEIQSCSFLGLIEGKMEYSKERYRRKDLRVGKMI